MPTEHHSASPETHERTNTDLDRHEQLDKVREATAEQDPSDHPDRRAEAARKVIEQQNPEPKPAAEDEAKPTGRTSAAPFLNHHLNYVQTLASMQRRLKPASRQFSKVIHAPIIEKASEALETTVARPSVLLGTTWTALIVGAIFYLTAHHYGYALSGSELLFSFIVGALLGLVLEGVWRLAGGNRRRP